MDDDTGTTTPIPSPTLPLKGREKTPVLSHYSMLEVIFCAFLAENDFINALIRFIRAGGGKVSALTLIGIKVIPLNICNHLWYFIIHVRCF